MNNMEEFNKIINNINVVIKKILMEENWGTVIVQYSYKDDPQEQMLKISPDSLTNKEKIKLRTAIYEKCNMFTSNGINDSFIIKIVPSGEIEKYVSTEIPASEPISQEESKDNNEQSSDNSSNIFKKNNIDEIKPNEIEPNESDIPSQKTSKTNSKGVRITCFVMGCIVGAVCFGAAYKLIRKSSPDKFNNNSNSTSTYLSTEPTNKDLFDIEKDSEQIINEVYNDLNGTDKANFNGIYDISKEDITIMLLVANGIDPFNKGFSSQEIMEAISTAAVQATHVGGIESVASGEIFESRTEEKLPKIFADPHDYEIISKFAEYKEMVIDSAYNKESKQDIQSKDQEALEYAVNFVLLNGTYNYSDGTETCFESLSSFTQMIAIDYTYALLAMASPNVKVTISDVENNTTTTLNMDEIAKLLSTKTGNASTKLGQLYTCPEKVKTK